jgi:hypothetical protein
MALAPRLAALRAVGGLRAWAEDAGRRASSPPTVLLFAASDRAAPQLNIRSLVSPGLNVSSSDRATQRPDYYRRDLLSAHLHLAPALGTWRPVSTSRSRAPSRTQLTRRQKLVDEREQVRRGLRMQPEAAVPLRPALAYPQGRWPASHRETRKAPGRDPQVAQRRRGAASSRGRRSMICSNRAFRPRAGRFAVSSPRALAGPPVRRARQRSCYWPTPLGWDGWNGCGRPGQPWS